MSADQPELFEDSKVDYPAAYLPVANSPLYVSKLTVKNFKRFVNTEITLPQYAVLTGVNNSGKSTILQSISVAFECLRLCVNHTSWQVQTVGRTLSGFDFLPVNEPRDLWHGRKFQSQNTWMPITVRAELSNGFYFETQLNFYFGGLNLKVTDWNKAMGADAIKDALAMSPMLIPGHVELSPHEEYRVPAQIHRHAIAGQLSSILRNALLTLSQVSTGTPSAPGFDFVADAVKRHFGLDVQRVAFDELRDLEIRAPYREGTHDLDIVSAGSGLHQILKICTFIAWRKTSVVLLDEPDAHLHTSLQTQLAGFLQELVRTFGLQVIVSTHSKDLISCSPIESVLPVDPSSTTIKPIDQVEHLLTEYRKLGQLSNLDIALLFQSKRCLFVEGQTDESLLPTLAQKLKKNLFTGANQIVIFPFRGVDKFTMIKDLAELFQRMIGSNLSWYVLRDRDVAPPEMLEHQAGTAKSKGIERFHIWNRYSIENYLIDPSTVRAAVTSAADKAGKTVPSGTEIDTWLWDASEIVYKSTRSDFVEKVQFYYVRNEVGSDMNDSRTKGTNAALAYLDNCKDLQTRIEVLRGTEIFGQFVGILQKHTGLTIRLNDLVDCLTPENAPIELLKFFDELDSLSASNS
ncbi:AAA family ATPase [bacterium]|nr:AAA family ATPase [bacterium]